VTGVLHIADQDAVLVEVLPTDGNYFLLAARREDCERDDARHRQHTIAPSFNQNEMLHELVQFIDSRASVAFTDILDNSKALKHYEIVGYFLTCERIAPSRFGNSKDRAHMTEVILSRCW